MSRLLDRSVFKHPRHHDRFLKYLLHASTMLKRYKNSRLNFVIFRKEYFYLFEIYLYSSKEFYTHQISSCEIVPRTILKDTYSIGKSTVEVDYTGPTVEILNSEGLYETVWQNILKREEEKEYE